MSPIKYLTAGAQECTIGTTFLFSKVHLSRRFELEMSRESFLVTSSRTIVSPLSECLERSGMSSFGKLALGKTFLQYTSRSFSLSL